MGKVTHKNKRYSIEILITTHLDPRRSSCSVLRFSFGDICKETVALMQIPQLKDSNHLQKLNPKQNNYKNKTVGEEHN